MGGADRFSVQQLCNYLRTNLLSSVASMNKFLSCSPVLKADTGASANFTRAQDTGLLDNIRSKREGLWPWQNLVGFLLTKATLLLLPIQVARIIMHFKLTSQG